MTCASYLTNGLTVPSTCHIVRSITYPTVLSIDIGRLQKPRLLSLRLAAPRLPRTASIAGDIKSVSRFLNVHHIMINGGKHCIPQRAVQYFTSPFAGGTV